MNPKSKRNDTENKAKEEMRGKGEIKKSEWTNAPLIKAVRDERKRGRKWMNGNGREVKEVKMVIIKGENKPDINMRRKAQT